MSETTRPAGESRSDPDGGHLERSRRVWNWWSDHYERSESDYEPMRETTVRYLDLEPGDAVLDIGCGPGVNFELLREAVGPEGRIVAIDYSPKMVDRARKRVTERGWENVEVRRADATRADLEPSAYDAAIATLSLSVMPSPEEAVERVCDALVPGGRFAVFDIRRVPSGPLRIVNPLLARALHLVANWNVDSNVTTAVERTFGDCDVVETYFAGVNYTAVATRRPAE
ncbi:class I SAM-dependent methyltransferase [Halostella pelagica]|uniref:class I SAM-dependent methyltransferase n=1 Tax=Halostella pelagica TaxID=2583824 RepID=UPI001081E9DA|nr:class I SAM-dependent methyltransferase [Halostella pelagica]